MMRIYLAGPCTGMPDFNYPAFNAAAVKLRDMGYHIQNPAENPAPACGSWEAYMRMSIRQLTMCDAIVVLPGWEKSRGACEEVRVASMFGMTVYPLSYFEG
jgi:hypothetical protein